ncbi:GAP family protein [Mycobacterium sp. 94-17]|uniref:GAP family protein n=1 Tax=Mycobacterium sp. 94-17 TaxID=2986147 RepID=UPI002D1EB3ED|nr:GAP family protein [Mycobacterium sp. 94-17]MEB4209236.1 GAP family protein [Mycobacterium sp. 94-17]
MWATVLVLALWVATDPTRLVIVALLMSRLRPRRNLVAYWLGGLAAGIGPAAGIFGLMLATRSSVPPVMADMRSAASRFTGGYFQIVVGVIGLLIAAAVAARFRPRRHVEVPTYGGFPSAADRQPLTSTAIARMRARAGRALQGGNPWLAFGIGLVSTMPPIDYLVVLVVIVSSGAALGTQLGAVVIFTLVVLVCVEVPLVSYLVMPVQTHALVQRLRRFAVAQRRRILIAAPAVAGVLLIAAGLGSV